MTTNKLSAIAVLSIVAIGFVSVGISKPVGKKTTAWVPTITIIETDAVGHARSRTATITAWQTEPNWILRVTTDGLTCADHEVRQ